MRPMTRDDATRLNDFLAVVEAVDRTGEHYNTDDVLEELDSPLTDPSTDWVLAEIDGEIVGHWRLFPRAVNDGEQSVTLDGAVRPDRRRQGIGSLLMTDMVARGLAYVRERDDSVRAVLTASGMSTNTDQADLFTTAGLKPHRWSFQMEATTTGEIAAAGPVPDGLVIEPYTDADADALREAHNVAFLDHPDFTPWDEPMWKQWVTGSRNFRPGLSFLVRDDAGAIAAYLQTNEYDAIFASTGRREAYVAKVGTLRGHRGKGLASILLRHALASYQAAGFDRASLDVDSENPTGALGVYERAGFSTTNRWTNYRLEG
jgi:mycothiol synthase